MTTNIPEKQQPGFDPNQFWSDVESDMNKIKVCSGICVDMAVNAAQEATDLLFESSKEVITGDLKHTTKMVGEVAKHAMEETTECANYGVQCAKNVTQWFS